MARYCLLLLACLPASAQEDNTRQLWNQEFLKKRPAGTGTGRAPQVKYKPTGVSGETGSGTPGAGAGTMLGITLWRVRPPKPSDPDGTRLLVLGEPGGPTSEETQERVEAGMPLRKGDRIRIAVEIPLTGYLYVIEREHYDNDSWGDPTLIYPNKLTRAAVLCFLVSPDPIADLRSGGSMLRLDTARFADWQKRWAVKTERYELEGGTGKAWTARENQAGANRAVQLTQDDPVPQTLYRVAAKPGSPILLEVPLTLKQ